MNFEIGDIIKYNDSICLTHSYKGNFYFKIYEQGLAYIKVSCIFVQDDSDIRKVQFRKWLLDPFSIWKNEFKNVFVMSSQHEIDKIKIFK